MNISLEIEYVHHPIFTGNDHFSVSFPLHDVVEMKVRGVVLGCLIPLNRFPARVNGQEEYLWSTDLRLVNPLDLGCKWTTEEVRAWASVWERFLSVSRTSKLFNRLVSY